MLFRFTCVCYYCFFGLFWKETNYCPFHLRAKCHRNVDSCDTYRCTKACLWWDVRLLIRCYTRTWIAKSRNVVVSHSFIFDSTTPSFDICIRDEHGNSRSMVGWCMRHVLLNDFVILLSMLVGLGLDHERCSGKNKKRRTYTVGITGNFIVEEFKWWFLNLKKLTYLLIPKTTLK